MRTTSTTIFSPPAPRWLWRFDSAPRGRPPTEEIKAVSLRCPEKGSRMLIAVRRGAFLTGTVVLLLLVGSHAASAHGIGATSKTVEGFIPLGIKHMLLGWDHLLFVAGVLVLARRPRRAVETISLFAAGHSITLFLATIEGWQVNPTAVDIVVALSLVFVGVVGVLGQPRRWWWVAAAVFAFGLVHGLGLSTRLQDLGLPDDGLVPRVLAFNVGIEIGQLLAIACMVAVGIVVRTVLPRLRDTRLAHGTLAGVGAIAAVALAVTGGETATAQTVGSCQVRDRTETFPFSANHPTADFFDPTDQVPANAFGHIIGDGFVIVQYTPDLPPDDLAALRGFVTDPGSGRVAGGPNSELTEPLKAIHAYSTLTCTTFDLDALRQFTAGWFDDPRSKPAD